ncbi:MAG: 1-acyl-sn-glycerol-3-phosphate acyltransferase [Chloroflexota bacterium]
MSFVGKALFEIFRFPIAVLFHLAGWKITRKTLEQDKLVLTGTPHTSNWDYPLFLASSIVLRRKMYVTVKSELFFFPIAGLLKAIGCIPVYRDSSNNLVDQLVEMVNSRERILLLFTPSGTRSYAEYWKSGFYWTAHKAGVPILNAIANYKTKTVHMHVMYEPSGDLEADLEYVRQEQEKHGHGLYPEKTNPVRTRAEYEASLEENASDDDMMDAMADDDSSSTQERSA